MTIKANKFIATCCGVFCIFLYTKVAFSWTRHIDFENGIIGEDGFSYAGLAVTRTNSISNSGTWSAKIHFESGDSCWDKQLTSGAIVGNFSSPISNGSNLWTRLYIYFPDSWDWGDKSEGGLWRKILRYAVANRGHISIVGLWDKPNNRAMILGNTESGNYYPYDTQLTGAYFPKGRWFCLEQYVHFGISDESSIHLVWLDGNLIFDSREIAADNPILGVVNDQCTKILFFTYWNGGVRTSQDAFIDNILITTDTPSIEDIDGNPMVGPSNWVGGGLPGTVGNTLKLDTVNQ